VTHLTPHFTLEEFTVSETAARHGINNVPAEGSVERKGIQRTAEVMEHVRTILGHKPIFITSGYRSPEVNKKVGGSKNSAHMSGLAVDFSCSDFGPPIEVCKALEGHMKALGIDQLIHEYDSWVHLGLTGAEPRHMAMTIDSNGTHTGFV
jgi:hypothetical protein